MRKFLGADNNLRNRREHHAYLLRCAAAWRAEPGQRGPQEEQAQRVEKMAAQHLRDNPSS